MEVCHEDIPTIKEGDRHLPRADPVKQELEGAQEPLLYIHTDSVPNGPGMGFSNMTYASLTVLHKETSGRPNKKSIMANEQNRAYENRFPGKCNGRYLLDQER